MDHCIGKILQECQSGEKMETIQLLGNAAHRYLMFSVDLTQRYFDAGRMYIISILHINSI